jgi:hypothetical protein
MHEVARRNTVFSGLLFPAAAGRPEGVRYAEEVMKTASSPSPVERSDTLFYTNAK